MVSQGARISRCLTPVDRSVQRARVAPHDLGARLRRLGVVAVLSAPNAPGLALADDAGLQRVLQAARCVSAKVRLLEKKGTVSVFQAVCGNGAGKVLTVTCGRSGCHREEEDEPLD